MPSDLVFGRSEEIEKWVADRIPGCARLFGECQAVGVSNGEIIAGVVFHNWSPENRTIEVSAAADSPKWATRANLTRLLDYPFGALGCRLVLARHSEFNRRARKLWGAMGAKEYFIPDLRADGEGEAIAVLSSDAWAKSRLNNGQTKGT